MLKRITCSFFACLFLASSTLLPLGDFSLLRDIPQMYRNYTRITTADELGIADFIGDYLLHGKELFGNNYRDKQQNDSNPVQFQHQANALNVVINQQQIIFFTMPQIARQHPPIRQTFYAFGYTSQFFRPPLA